MRKHRTLKILCIVCAALLGAALIGWAVCGVWQEGARTDTETLAVRIPGFSLDMPETDAWMREYLGGVHGSMPLTEGVLKLRLRDGTVLDGSLELSYFRYINDLREGGNVESLIMTVEPVTGTLVKKEHFVGSGRACTVRMAPVRADTLTFPLRWYLDELATLAGVDASDTVQATFHYTNWGLDVSVSAPDDSAVLYTERLTGWNGTDGFRERKS